MVARWFEPWKRRILSMIGKCVITAIDDSSNLQLTQITFLKDEVIDDVERIQQFGFTSTPPSGSEGIVAFIGGNQSHPIVISTDNSEYRLKGLQDGACAIYNSNGDYVKLTQDKIEVYATEITLGNGSEFKKLITEEFQNVFNNHGHDYVPSGTGTPAISGKPVVGIPATNAPSTITDNEMTTKTKAE